MSAAGERRRFLQAVLNRVTAGGGWNDLVYQQTDSIMQFSRYRTISVVRSTSSRLLLAAHYAHCRRATLRRGAAHAQLRASLRRALLPQRRRCAAWTDAWQTRAAAHCWQQ